MASQSTERYERQLGSKTLPVVHPIQGPAIVVNQVQSPRRASMTGNKTSALLKCPASHVFTTKVSRCLLPLTSSQRVCFIWERVKSLKCSMQQVGPDLVVAFNNPQTVIVGGDVWF